MPEQKYKKRDAKIHKILAVAPKLDNITYLSALIVAFAMSAHRLGMYEPKITVAFLFFTTTLMVTNFTISMSIDWLKKEITPHLTPQETPSETKKGTIMQTLTTATPTLRLFSTFVSLVFSIIIYYSFTPSTPHKHPDPYFKYLTSLILFSLPTIYIAITAYASLKEKALKENKEVPETHTLQIKDTRQTANQATTDIR